MASPLFEMRDLHASVGAVSILKGIDLVVRPGEIHAIMGPNGAGKSTLAKVVAGHPSYEIERGDILLAGQSLLPLEPAERSHQGIFIGFQYPLEVSGVSNFQFLKASLSANRKARGLPDLSEADFQALLEEKLIDLDIKKEFLERNLNEGFSGGEKKRNEILQMAILAPRLAILDETDSGLDIDALRVVAKGVNQMAHSEMGLIIITHYQRLLEYIRPDFVHVMMEGKIVQSGDASLPLKLEERGYDWLLEEDLEGG